MEVGRLTHKERAWTERRLTGRITELNQRMWRVTQRLVLETSRCAPVPSRPNSSLVAAHCARTRTDLRTCVDVLLYAMGRLQLCIPWRLDRYVQLAHQLEFQQHDATTASLMSTAFIDSTAAASGSEAVTSTPDITPPQYDLFNDDLLMVTMMESWQTKCRRASFCPLHGHLHSFLSMRLHTRRFLVLTSFIWCAKV